MLKIQAFVFRFAESGIHPGSHLDSRSQANPMDYTRLRYFVTSVGQARMITLKSILADSI